MGLDHNDWLEKRKDKAATLAIHDKNASDLFIGHKVLQDGQKESHIRRGTSKGILDWGLQKKSQIGGVVNN